MIAYEVEELCFRYKKEDAYIFKDLSFVIKKGEILGIAGDSGAGKSSLLFCLTTIIPNHIRGIINGKIKLLSKEISSYQQAELFKKIGFIFQDPDMQLFTMKVEDEVAFGLENMCLDPPEIDRRINQALELVGMTAYRHSYLNKLSGGQRQLIAIAAVLSMKPEIIFLDEAFAQLDSVNKQMLKKQLVLLKKSGCTIVIADHDNNILSIADRTVYL